MSNEQNAQKEAANKFKYEVSDEISFPLRYGFGGDIRHGAGNFTSGYLVKRMIEAQERQMQNQGK